MPKTEDAFLPPDYEVPKAPGKYLKFRDGVRVKDGLVTRFRILSPSPVMGSVGWTEIAGKPRPVRKPMGEMWKHGEVKDDKVAHFWLLAVWNYDVGRVQVLELTQSTIQEPIKDFARDADYGNPTGYDIVVKQVVKGDKTSYTVTPKPRKPLEPEVKAAWDELQDRFDLTRMFANGDPFGDEMPGDSSNGHASDDAPPDDGDIPF